MKRFLLALAFLPLMASAGWAACANTVSVKDASGTTKTYCVGTDGGTNLLANFNLVDSTGLNFAGVNAGHELSTTDATTHTDLGTINTTLGSPFQAGGSIGNTAFTANAGTNLNTSALALESGGNLATLAGAVSSSKMNVNLSSVTGTNVPAGVTNSTGTNQAQIQCDSFKFVHVTSATDTLLVQGVTAKTVRVCGVVASFSGSAAQSFFLENTASTNANCSSANTQITALVTGNASSPMPYGWYNPTWGGLANTSANGLCVNTSGTGGVDIQIWYEQG